MKKIILSTILFAAAVYGVTVYAGTITPPSGTPAAQFYTLSEIYNFINSNTTATEGTHSFTFGSALSGSGYTLTQIYSSLASLIDATKVLTGTTYLGTAGTMANNGAFALAAGAADQAVTAGYYSGGTLTGDADLISGNIKSGADIFGVAGDSNVVDTSSGDAAAGDIANNKIAFVDGSSMTGSMFTNQKNQTIDDWVDSGGTSGEYIAEEATWSAVSGSPFTGSDAINFSAAGATWQIKSGIVKQDLRSGLWWTDVAATTTAGGVGLSASSTSNIFTLTGVAGVGDGTRPTGGNAIGFCDALNSASFAGYTDWYLPTQKQLMQAYIDGAANNLPNPGYYFWSSSEYYNNTAYAWDVILYYGYTGSNTKVTSYYVRCVRP